MPRTLTDTEYEKMTYLEKCAYAHEHAGTAGPVDNRPDWQLTPQQRWDKQQAATRAYTDAAFDALKRRNNTAINTR